MFQQHVGQRRILSVVFIVLEVLSWKQFFTVLKIVDGAERRTPRYDETFFYMIYAIYSSPKYCTETRNTRP
jgi:hypothetical protein